MRHNVKKSYINSQFGQVHFQIYGDGTPLILCHQSPSSLEMFNSAYPVLASLGIQSIGIDTPGYGQSDGPSNQPRILDYAQCVIDVIASTGYDKVSLLGHHTGACIVAELASIRPDLINKIILNGPPVLTQDEKQTMLQMIENAPSVALKKDGSHLLKLWNKRIEFTPGWTNLDAMQNGNLFWDAIEKITGDSRIDVQIHMEIFIEDNYNWMFLANASKSIFIILPFILVGGFLYKRKRNKRIIDEWETEELLEKVEWEQGDNNV